MTPRLSRWLDRIMTGSRLELFPVRVRRGVAQGARWTLYPWSAYWRGNQEPEMHEVLMKLGDIRGWSCWDLWAHFGLYSVGLARRVGPKGEVSAFEPNPLSFSRLERHRRMNGLTWLKPFQAAVSDSGGTAEFYTYGNLKATTTHLPFENETPGPETGPITVNTLVLDELVDAGRIRAPDLMKVDVEGHAHRALRGAQKAISAKRPTIVIAIHSEPELRGVREVVSALNYDEAVIQTASGSNDAFIGHDLLLTPRR